MIIIRKARLDDIDGIVRIHQYAFKSFFLTSLGKRFLKLYYTSFVASDKGTVFCALKEQEVIGFSACSYISKGFNISLIKENIVKFGAETIYLLFTKPNAIVRLLKNLNKESKDSVIKDDGIYAELYSIAVNPVCQGEGVGKKLLIVTESNVKEHNNRVSLTTDYYDNEKTISFYRGLGYREFYDFVTYPNRRMWRMMKDLD